jgi:hypothetical protein
MRDVSLEEIMLTKETAKQIIDSLPDDATMDDIIHALYIKIKFARGEREIREDKGIVHEEAKKRLEGCGN